MKFTSKAELLEQIRTEYDAFLELASSIPESRYDERGVWGDGWTVKDLFTHLTEWKQMFLGWHRQGLAGETPAMPAPGYKWNETPRLNRQIQRKHAGKSWKRGRKDFDASYDEIIALAESLTEAELLEPGHFPWTKKLSVSSYLAPNTSMHYRTASKILKRWKKQQAM